METGIMTFGRLILARLRRGRQQTESVFDLRLRAMGAAVAGPMAFGPFRGRHSRRAG